MPAKYTMYYDRAGQPLETFEWAALYEDRKYQVVAQDTVDPLWVSTIWLGIDHSWGASDKPLIFETMVFLLRDGAREELFQYRYTTEAEAREAHGAIVGKLRELIVAGRLAPGDVCALLADLPMFECEDE